MNWDTILHVLVAGVPFEAAVLVWLWHFIGSRLPQAQIALLNQFALTAVREVEQLANSGALDPAERKAKALETVRGLFEAAGRKPPPDAAISAFVESAVYLVGIAQGKFAAAALPNPLSAGHEF